MDDVAAPPRRLPRLLGKIATGVAAVLLVAAAGVGYAARNLSPAAGVAYLTATVRQGDLSSGVSATGPIVAPTAVPLNFKQSGKVAKIDVKVGDTVKAGQILAKLDPTDFQFQLRQAQANLEATQATYDNLVEGPLPADVKTAQAAVAAADRQQSDTQASMIAAREQAAKDTSLAQAGVTTAQTNLFLVQIALKSAQDQEAKILAADKTTVANTQKNLNAVTASVAANQPVLEQQVQKAKDDLWSAQTSRDGTCGHGGGAACDAANASVGAAQTAVNMAQAQLVAGQKQGAQQIADAQAQPDQAQSQLTSDQAKEDATVSAAQGQIKQANDALNTVERSAADAQAKAMVYLPGAQAQVHTTASAEQTAQTAYAKTVSPPTPAEIANAKAQVAAQQALVDEAQANLDSATLTAPSAGVVTALNGAVGQWLSGGSTSGAATSAASGANNAASNNPSNFVSLTDLSTLQVDAQVNEADVGRVKVGQPVTFTVDAFPDRTFDGEVTVVRPLGTSSNNVVTYTVIVEINRASGQLLPGMTANITILTTDVPNTLIVPSTAISFAQSQGASAGARAPGPATVIVVASGKGTPRQIQTGVSDDRNTQVLSGLNPGEEVATGTAPS